MFLIDTATAGPGNTWVEAALGVSPTVSSAPWLNALQEEYAQLVEAAGLPLDPNADDQVRAALQIHRDGAGIPNLLVNGAFDLWQRGTGVSPHYIVTSNQYTADRWVSMPGGGGTAEVYRLLRGSASPMDQLHAPYSYALEQTVAATGTKPGLAQRIEDVRALSGASLSGQFWLDRITAETTNVSVRLVQNFGSGGSPSFKTSEIDLGAVSLAPTAYPFEITLPSTSGKTIGAGSYTELQILFDTGTTFWLEVMDVVLERNRSNIGLGAREFPRRPLSVEYALAARYFEKSYRLDDEPGAGQAVTLHPMLKGFHSEDLDAGSLPQIRSLSRRFRVRKRAVPTLTWYAPVSGDAGKVEVDFVERAVTSTNGTDTNVTGHPAISGLSVTGDAYARAHFTADAEL